MQKSMPVGTLVLLCLNFVLFFVGVQQPASGTDTLANILVSMFSHGSFSHLAGNMLLLFFLAPKVERTLENYFVPFYILCGMGAHFGFGLLDPHGRVLGASGAISGLFVAYVFCCQYWSALLISGFICGSYFVGEFLAMLDQRTGFVFDPIAHAAHLAGAMSGFILLLAYFSKQRR